MKGWARRAARLHAELAEVADVRDPRWWLVAGGAALPWPTGDTYVSSDGEPASDTFIGVPSPAPAEPLALALAARTALRELVGQLAGQPLAITLERAADGTRTSKSRLSIAAFARGDRVWCVRLDDPHRELSLYEVDEPPFVCISIGSEPIATARHGHRRAWHDLDLPSLGIRLAARPGRAGACGPWLGIGHADGLTVVSTCHMVVDGYGHAQLAARIAELTADAPRAEASPPLAPVPEAQPLLIAWRELTTRPRALELAYALGRVMHRLAGDPHARFSPTFQIPIAPGDAADPRRMGRRVLQTIASVRFSGGQPEPFAEFAARTKSILANEVSGTGVSARLMATAQGLPIPLAWKRRAIGASRPGWLDALASVIGGRGCVSRIAVDARLRPAVTVSCPARLATADDPLGSCVVTVIDDGERASITLCGSGTSAAPERLDELLASLPQV